MNAEIEISRLLKESGAVLVRQNKHQFYRLPNGQNFVLAKTSGDPVRAAKNSLSELRRGLSIPRNITKQQGVQQVSIENSFPSAAHLRRLSAPEPAESVATRISAAIVREESSQEKLLAEAQAVERRIQTLKALEPFAGDPSIEGLLRDLLPAAEPPAPLSPPPLQQAEPDPPQQVTTRIQVTRQLVFAATQTFEGTFTVNEVMTLMTGGAEIEGAERQRVRMAIAQAMMSLYERGELIREAEAYGRRQAVWRKATLTGNGNGSGVRA